MAEIFQRRCLTDKFLNLLGHGKGDIGVEVAAREFLDHPVVNEKRSFITDFLLRAGVAKGFCIAI